uniref:Uncharacterized protein n=1 Tax=Romanomermis culicivorax TaxID=13658 RepID=A0A915HSE8_ROMCU
MAYLSGIHERGLMAAYLTRSYVQSCVYNAKCYSSSSQICCLIDTISSGEEETKARMRFVAFQKE